MKDHGMTEKERLEIGAKVVSMIFGKPGTTIKQISSESGVSQTTITKIVRGGVPSTMTALRLLKLWSGGRI